MATTIEVYSQVAGMFMAVGILTTDIKIALIDNTYAFSAAHTSFDTDAQPKEVTGTGYTAGGITLSGKVITGGTTFKSNDPEWSILSATFRRGIVYAVGTFDGVVNPVLFSVLFDNSPSDIVIVASDFSPAWNALGIYTISTPT